MTFHFFKFGFDDRPFIDDSINLLPIRREINLLVPGIVLNEFSATKSLGRGRVNQS
jgi:hypothetical protein